MTKISGQGSIGGFLEFELLNQKDLASAQEIGFSSGRSAFAFLLEKGNIDCIQLPYYTCDVILEPLEKMGVSYSFYSLSNNLLPQTEASNFDKDKPFLLNNYFGLLDKSLVAFPYLENAIIDNSQALYSAVSGGLGAFNSYRKFLGVPDGGDAFKSGRKLNCNEERFKAAKSMTHLFGRIESGPTAYYTDFQKNDAQHTFSNVRAISEIGQRMFQTINHNSISQSRRLNYSRLERELLALNELKLPLHEASVPLCYPFLHPEGAALRKFLHRQKVYTPMYWPNKKIVPKPNSFEAWLNKNLVAIPIDQRYSLIEMEFIESLIKKFLYEH